MNKEIDRIIIDSKGTEREVQRTPRQIIEERLPEERIIETPTERIPVSWRRNFDRLLEIQEAWKEVYPFKDEVTVRVESEYPNLPHLIGKLADPHIGAIGQSPLLGKHIDLFETTPNTSLIGLGDMADFGVWGHKEVRFLQGLPIPIQPFTVKDIMEELTIPERNPRGKKILLANIIGNHTYESFLTAGIFFESFFDKLDLPMLPGVGLIKLQVGNQEYDLGVAHKYWGNSRLNKTLSCKRLLEYVYPFADEIDVAHHHWKALEIMYRGGRRIVLGRPGHYRSEMPIFEQTRGYWEAGNEGMTCALYYPNKHWIEPFDDLEAGMARLAELCELDDYRKGLK